MHDRITIDSLNQPLMLYETAVMPNRHITQNAGTRMRNSSNQVQKRQCSGSRIERKGRRSPIRGA